MTNPTEARIRPEIPLLVVGFDFRSASAVLREKLVTTTEDRAYLMEAIKRIDDTAGILVLETCNRLEMIVSTLHPEWIAEILNAWMLNRWQKAFPQITDFPSPYEHFGEDAVIHVLRVVVGLESLALGEAQIAGQFQNALKLSQKEKNTSPIINRLSHIAGRIAKSGYKMGFRSNHRQGIHGLVAKFLENHFKENLSQTTILLVGMGEIGKRTAALIEESLGCRVQPLNRTITPSHQGKWKPLAELPQLSGNADAMVVATGAHNPVIQEHSLQLHQREKRLLIIDIGIPRQVAESLQHNPMIYYRNVDHLSETGGNLKKSVHQDRLEREIQKELENFKQFCRARELSDLLNRIHSGRLELTETRIPDFVRTHLVDLEPERQKKIEQEMKQFIKDFSNDIFSAFHNTMEKYWSANSNGN